jgi:hypothetical protein
MTSDIFGGEIASSDVFDTEKSRFDVFIKGIQAKKQYKIDQINQKLCHVLKINLHQLEGLWRKNNGNICMRRNISHQEAHELQTMLAQSGLIAYYKPTTRRKKLTLSTQNDEQQDFVICSTKTANRASELLFVHTAEKHRYFSCPKCQHKTKLSVDMVEPKRCNRCLVFIPDYLFNIKQQEKNHTRRRFLTKKKFQEPQKISNKEQSQHNKTKELLASSAIGILILVGIIGYLVSNSA